MILNNIFDKPISITFSSFLFLIFLFPFIVNSLFFYTLSYSLLGSFAFFVIFICIPRKDFKFTLSMKLVGWIFFILLHGIVSFSFLFYSQAPNLHKFYLSLIYLLLLVFFSDSSFQVLGRLRPYSVYKTFDFFSYFLLISAFSSFVFLFIHNGGRPIFFYSEPAHFVLAFIPFLIYKLSTSRKFELFLFSAFSFKLALMAPSAILLSSLLIYPALINRLKHLIFIYTSFFVVILTTIFFNFVITHSISSNSALDSVSNLITKKSTLTQSNPSFADLKLGYFIERLPLHNKISSNLSLDVYMSGWSRALINTKNTYGIGLGFQQLGYLGIIDKYLANISLNNSPFGFNDGGCVAAKLINEFGIFAIIAIISYLIGCFRAFNRIRSGIDGDNLKDLRFLMDIFYISFLVPLFLRSFGYFTPLFFILLISCIYNLKTKKVATNDQ